MVLKDYRFVCLTFSPQNDLLILMLMVVYIVRILTYNLLCMILSFPDLSSKLNFSHKFVILYDNDKDESYYPKDWPPV